MKILFVAALALGGALVHAKPTEVVTKSTDFGMVNLPFTVNLGQTLSPLPAPDGPDGYFIADYGFSTLVDTSLTSAVVTFNLSSVLELTQVSVSLLSGTSFAGAVPSVLTDAQVDGIARRTLATSTGDALTQTLSAQPLKSGDYVIEVRGLETGSAGGSYGGVLNLATVASVPEPQGMAMALGGLGFVGVVRRRRRARVR